MKTSIPILGLCIALPVLGAQPAHAQDVEQLIAMLERDLVQGEWRLANAATQHLNALGPAAEPSVPVVERVFTAAVETGATILIRNTTPILIRFSSDLPIEESLVQLLREDAADGRVRDHTLDALVACRERCSDAVPVLMEHLQSGDGGWFGAVEALRAMGTGAHQAIPLLERELRSRADDDLRRQLLRSALARIDPDNADTIITSLIDDVRNNVPYTLGELQALGQDLRAYVGDIVAIRRELLPDSGGPLTLSLSYVELLCTVGGEVAVSEAVLALEGEPGIRVVLAFGRLDGAPEALLALPGLVKALGSRVTAERAGMKANVGAPAYSLSVRAAAAMAIQRNGLEQEAWELMRRDRELMSTSWAGLISLGVEESVPALLALLRSTDRMDVASVFLNSGHPTLERAARTWAEANGYRVSGTVRSATAAAWGGRRR